MQWNTVRPIDGMDRATLFALRQGWLLIDGTALTDLGCSAAEALADL